MERYYNSDSTILLYEHPAKDEDVYILFNEQKNVGDDTKTSFTGNFQFQYLWPGNYKLYYYSKLSSASNEMKEIVLDVNLKKNQTLTLDTIYTTEFLDFDEGSANLKGVLIEKYYNKDSTVFQYSLPAKDKDVFILFGDQKNIGDDTKTGYSGNFQFQYLWPGDYKLYYYTDVFNAEIKTKKAMLIDDINVGPYQTYNLDTLYTYKSLEWDEGSAKIEGKVWLINYKNESTPTNLIVKDTTAAQELDIYIVYNNDDFYCDRIRTQGDGTFVFKNLIKGHYRIYLFSENVRSNTTGNIIIEKEVDITDIKQEVTLEEIFTEKI